MATPFVPLKIRIAYFNSRTLKVKTYYSHDKFLDFLHTTETSAILADFCLNFVSMATPFAPLKIYLNLVAMALDPLKFPIYT